MRRIQFTCALLFMLAWFAFTPRALSQTSPPPAPRRPVTLTGQQTGQPNASKSTQVTVEYDLRLMSQKLAALSEQVDALKQQNHSLAAQNKALENKLAQVQSRVNQIQASGAGSSPGDARLQSLDLKIKQLDTGLQTLDASYRKHTHSIPDIALTAFSKLPGMQDIATKVGIGNLKSQWDMIRVLWVSHSSQANIVTRPPDK